MLELKEGFEGERSIVLPPMAVDMQANDPLVSSLFITDIGYFPKAKFHSRERKEATRENILIYCVNGKGHYEVDGKEYAVGANQFFILPAKHPHRYWSDEEEPWTIYWVHFRGTHASYYADAALTPQDIRYIPSSHLRDRNNVFEEMFYTMEQSYSIENMRYVSSLLHYYLGSMCFQPCFPNDNTKPNRVDQEMMTKEAILYMQANIERKITLDEIVNYLGYSKSHFTSTFKSETGYTPFTYLGKIKIERACELMENTNMKLNQLCHKVGIDDSYYFSRLFKNIIGLSPRDYRNLKRRIKKAHRDQTDAIMQEAFRLRDQEKSSSSIAEFLKEAEGNNPKQS